MELCTKATGCSRAESTVHGRVEIVDQWERHRGLRSQIACGRPPDADVVGSAT